jgi:hypothetical protein
MILVRTSRYHFVLLPGWYVEPIAEIIGHLMGVHKRFAFLCSPHLSVPFADGQAAGG